VIKPHISSYFNLDFIVEFLTTIFITFLLFRSKGNKINSWILSSNSFSTYDNWFVMVLNLFRCVQQTYLISSLGWTTSLSDALCFFFYFSYMMDKATIISIMVLSFIILCATDIDKVKRITLKTCPVRRFHFTSSILFEFFYKRKKKVSFYKGNILSASFNTQNLWSNLSISNTLTSFQTITPIKTQT
jgi:hypothetical protein